MSPQEGLPRHPLLPQRDGVDPVLEKDPLDRVAPDLMTEIAEGAADSRVAPAGVVSRHPKNQPFDLGRCLGAARLARLAAIVFLGDQPPVPAKQRVRSHKSVDLEEPSAANLPSLGCETTALNVREQQALAAQLPAQYAVLLLQVFDEVLLAAVHPPGEDRDQELKLQRVHRRERTPVRMPEIDRRPRSGRLPILRNRSHFGSADFWHRTPRFPARGWFRHRRIARSCHPAFRFL